MYIKKPIKNKQVIDMLLAGTCSELMSKWGIPNAYAFYNQLIQLELEVTEVLQKKRNQLIIILVVSGFFVYTKYLSFFTLCRSANYLHIEFNQNLKHCSIHDYIYFPRIMTNPQLNIYFWPFWVFRELIQNFIIVTLRGPLIEFRLILYRWQI